MAATLARWGLHRRTRKPRAVRRCCPPAPFRPLPQQPAEPAGAAPGAGLPLLQRCRPSRSADCLVTRHCLPADPPDGLAAGPDHQLIASPPPPPLFPPRQLIVINKNKLLPSCLLSSVEGLSEALFLKSLSRGLLAWAIQPKINHA